MNTDQFKTLVQTVVAEAARLRDTYTNEHKAPVNYACIFSQSESEHQSLVEVASSLGKIVQETAMGPVFYTDTINTIAGSLRIIKIRKPDPKRIEQGDADFTVVDYSAFKQTYLGKPGFDIIKRPEMEMVELVDPSFNVLAYFSNPPLGKVLNLDF